MSYDENRISDQIDGGLHAQRELYILSAGICDTCSVPKMVNTGNGIDEPLYPILYCDLAKREITPEEPEARLTECKFHVCR